MTPRTRVAVVLLYVGYGIALVPLVVVIPVALAFYGIGGSFTVPSGAFLFALVLLWPVGLVLSLFKRPQRLLIGYIFLAAVAVSVAAFVAWVALAT